MTLCYLHASRLRQTGAITWDDYIHNLFARFRGIQHEEDNDDDIRRSLGHDDPFAYDIWCWSGRMEEMRDTSSLEAVFIAYRYGKVDEIKARYGSIDEFSGTFKDKNPRNNDSLTKETRKSLALLALIERKAEVLQFCFDQGGFAFEHDFYDEADKVDPDEDPDIFEVLEKSTFPIMSKEEKEWRWNSRDPAVIFDRGGRLPVPW